MADDASEEGSSTVVPDPDMLAGGPGAFLGDTNDESALEPVCRFLGKYVKYLHGENTIKKYVDTHKGNTFLNMLTPSDVAYSIGLIKNNQDVWKEQYEVTKMSKETQDKYKDKNDTDFVYKNKPLYTKGSGQKRQFGKVMWADEGTLFMRGAKDVWLKAFKNDEVKILLQRAWEKYSEANNDVASQHWKEDKTDKGIEEEQEDVGILEDDSDDEVQGFMGLNGVNEEGSVEDGTSGEEEADSRACKRGRGDTAEEGRAEKKRNATKKVTGPRRTPSTRAKVTRKKSGAGEDDS